MKNKFYIIPADIVESNFPDDLDKLNLYAGIVITERDLTELMNDILGAQPKIPY